MDEVNRNQQADKEVRLAEFAALRTEIAQRSSFQQALIALNLTAVGALLGVAASHDTVASAARHPNNTILLIVPIVSSVLGIMWLDHHRCIQGIAGYIQLELWIWAPSWEQHGREEGQQVQSRSARIFYFGAIGLVYAIGSACLGVGFPEGHGTGAWLLFAAGCALSASYTVWFILTVRNELTRARPTQTTDNAPSRSSP